jgi:hypothetical protein
MLPRSTVNGPGERAIVTTGGPMVTPACLLKLGSFWILLYADGFGSDGLQR